MSTKRESEEQMKRVMKELSGLTRIEKMLRHAEAEKDNEKTIPVGECFSYAFKRALKAITDDEPDVRIIHATVQPWPTDPRYYHAWIEKENIVYDWQTMELGGSKYAYTGWPKDVFYETFKPENMQIYTPKEVSMNTDKYGHTGPWIEGK